MAQKNGSVSFGALQRRMSKRADGMGSPGPSGGAKQLSPQDGRSAGPMIKKGKPEGGWGKTTKALAKGMKR